MMDSNGGAVSSRRMMAGPSQWLFDERLRIASRRNLGGWLTSSIPSRCDR